MLPRTVAAPPAQQGAPDGHLSLTAGAGLLRIGEQGEIGRAAQFASAPRFHLGAEESQPLDPLVVPIPGHYGPLEEHSHRAATRSPFTASFRRSKSAWIVFRPSGRARRARRPLA